MSKIQGVHIPADNKNLAINGNFDFWQRFEGNTTTVNTATSLNSSNNYFADQFSFATAGGTVKNFSVVRSTSVPTIAQSGMESTYSALFTMITGIASPVAADYVIPYLYKMEGLDFQRIYQKTVAIGFWCLASVPGTYNVAITNGAFTRSYNTSFVIASASTWQFVTVTVPGDTGGTWNFDNTQAFVVCIGAYAGTTGTTSTPNTWQTGVFYAATGGTNWQATSGATLQIAQFSIMEGALGAGPKGFQRQGKGLQQELALCQRYYFKTFLAGTAPAQNAGNNNIFTFPQTVAASTGLSTSPSLCLPVTMRVQPTCTSYNPLAANAQIRNTSTSTDFSTTGFVESNTNYISVTGTSPAGSSAGNSCVIHITAEAGM